MRIKTLEKFNTEFPADTVEFCPNVDYTEYFTCGTYNLEKNNEAEASNATTSPCRRKGTLILFKFVEATKKIIEIQRLQTAAILDMKWLPPSPAETTAIPTLATANALGQVDIYTLQTDCLVLRASIECNTECDNLLTLSLDWDWPIKGTTTAMSTRRLLASDSKGDINLLEYTVSESNYTLKLLKTWSAHNFEAWICAFDKWNQNLVYTGGDDIMLHTFDLRSYERVLTNRSHLAGVTSFLSHPKREHILLTGSYDERMRIFDTRSMRNPLGEINLEGGIWRLKSDPISGDLILAACMYKNFSLVRLPMLGSGEQNPELVGVYNEHESICYGADWYQNVKKDGDLKEALYMATCSFYDNKLCVSQVNI